MIMPSEALLFCRLSLMCRLVTSNMCISTFWLLDLGYNNHHSKDVSVNSPTFNEAYKNIITYIIDTVGRSDALRERFNMVQQDLIQINQVIE
ncbi:hypothetical protein K503DRAFT_632917 [Rhizopogon vinicolor AM-OR11-026]|uniref:Uncharacterized protein n=1 Tax=Rhizopogon vinicolor AM-OR11-026 TaxID=1314800 RepID=A0A1B7MHR8_9AGAM|nr:hypothetical protein K503DRAFT_632917 [Rhizopogon vinicolor AM-OR11-026]